MLPDILITNPIFTLFLLLLIGNAIGLIAFRGITLGSAGVLLTALVFGHFGLKLPKELTDLGLVLFVYSIGLSAGPGFIKAFRQQGKPLVLVAVVSLLVAAVLCVVLGRLFGIPRDIAAGIFAGSLTNTPSLAAGMELAGKLGLTPSDVSVGYGIAYPYSIVGVTLAVQLLPRILGKSLKKEDADAQKAQAQQANKLERKQFIVANPSCIDQPIETLQLRRFGSLTISRVYRNKTFIPATSSTILAKDDIVTLVGSSDDLDQMGLLFGKEVSVPLADTAMSSLDIPLASRELVGKTLRDSAIGDKYNIIVTRIRKYDGNEIAPYGDYELEDGDVLRVVGAKEDVEQFLTLATEKDRRAGEFHIVPFMLGLVIGCGIGIIPIPLPGGGQITIGMAAGAFLVSLVLSAYGRIGNMRFRVSSGAVNLARELGLVIFLAGAGVSAGASFVQVFEKVGPSVLFVGFLVTTITLIVAVVMMTRVLKLQLLTTDGALSGLMTNPPALNAAKSQSVTDVPTLAYATIYPFAMLLKIVLIQVILIVMGIGATTPP